MNGRNFYIKAAIAACLLVLVITACGFCLGRPGRDTACGEAGQIRYESYVVESGDTLWSIGGRYRESAFASREAYIHEVMRVNQLTSSRIYEGDLLVLPGSEVSVQFSSAAD